MWSGGWSLSVDRSGGGLKLSLGLSAMKTTVGGQEIAGPHALFGVVNGGMPQATEALRSNVLNGLRGGRALPAPVTYNTWFAYGIDIDENAMLEEMDRAAALGVELFVV